MEGFRKMINWHLEKRKISELKNWDKNPRTISEKAFKELEQSVDTLGNFEPLVINVDGTVIAGNQRLRLETKKGNNEVDVYVPERELTEEEIKKIGVISNRHSGEWDMDILANEFEDILKDLNIDLGVTTLEGFGENFELKEGDKTPFQQITFTLSDEQANEIREAITKVKQTDDYKYCETFGNENTNGNALYLIISQWGQKT